MINGKLFIGVVNAIMKGGKKMRIRQGQDPNAVRDFLAFIMQSYELLKGKSFQGYYVLDVIMSPENKKLVVEEAN